MTKYKIVRFSYFYIFIMNLVDAVLTHYSVTNKLAREANPLMDYLLELSPIYFYLCKIVLVVLGLILLRRLGDTNGTRLALFICASVYTLIFFIHARILF